MRVFTCVYASVCACLCTCVFVCMRACMRVCVLVHLFVYVCTCSSIIARMSATSIQWHLCGVRHKKPSAIARHADYLNLFCTESHQVHPWPTLLSFDMTNVCMYINALQCHCESIAISTHTHTHTNARARSYTYFVGIATFFRHDRDECKYIPNNTCYSFFTHSAELYELNLLLIVHARQSAVQRYTGANIVRVSTFIYVKIHHMHVQ